MLFPVKITQKGGDKGEEKEPAQPLIDEEVLSDRRCPADRRQKKGGEGEMTGKGGKREKGEVRTEPAHTNFFSCFTKAVKKKKKKRPEEKGASAGA